MRHLKWLTWLVHSAHLCLEYGWNMELPMTTALLLLVVVVVAFMFSPDVSTFVSGGRPASDPV